MKGIILAAGKGTRMYPMAEGLVTLAGSRLYTSAAYTEEMIDDVLSRFDRVLANCGPLE